MKPIKDGLDRGANPRTSTKYTFTECIVDGGELGIDRRKRERGEPGRRDRKSATKLNANDNFATSEFALAA